MPAKPARVLANAKDLIDTIADRGPLGPAELAAAIDVPRPSVYRLAAALEAVGLVAPLPDGRIELGRRWLALADGARAAMTEWRHADEALGELADATGQTAFLSVPRGDEAVCVAWAPGRGIEVLALRPGRALPLHVGAAGRALLAFAPDERAEAFLARGDFPALTAHTLTTSAQLRADRDETRRRGYALSLEDVTAGIGAVGVPVRDGSGAVTACLSLGSLIEDVTRDIEGTFTRLERTAERLAAP